MLSLYIPKKYGSGCGLSPPCTNQAVAVACPSKAPAMKHFWLERRWVPTLSRKYWPRNFTRYPLHCRQLRTFLANSNKGQKSFRNKVYVQPSPNNNYPASLHVEIRVINTGKDVSVKYHSVGYP